MDARNSRRRRVPQDSPAAKKATAGRATAPNTKATGRPPRATQPARTSSRGLARRIGDNVADFLSRPSVDYTMLLIITGALTFVGLIMAASITGPSSFYDDSGQYISGASVYGQFLRQFIMVCLGAVAFYFALRISPAQLRRFTPALMVLAVVLLLLVFTPLGIGEAEKGSQSWLKFGPLRLQPSEVAKVALVMWGADWLAGRRARLIPLLDRVDRLIVYTGMMVLVCGLIFAENDLGMTLTVLVVGSIVVFLGGASYKSIGSALALFVPLALAFIWFGHGSSGNNFRASRLQTFLDGFTGDFANTQNEAFQSYQGFLSLAEGGLFGVGVGQSRAKWFYLPEAKNDFVFAIVGEELGSVGAIMVLLLFVFLGFFGLRAARRNADPYLRFLAGGLVLGIVFQALYNIGYVVGLLPVTGIQLPLISVGGTSTIITLASLGLVANCARHEPEHVSAIADRGRSNFDKWLGLPAPRPYRADAPEEPTRRRPRGGEDASARRTAGEDTGRGSRTAGSAARTSRQPRSSRQVPVTARGRAARSSGGAAGTPPRGRGRLGADSAHEDTPRRARGAVRRERTEYEPRDQRRSPREQRRTPRGGQRRGRGTDRR
ncbi:FtsW/RodA/SpoVE family cell cycle protein [Corynebacterium sp. 13CS0277]|uniref:FtsW/RodA/SpoVE family cell cycle protein n=1 Tax=Corynebacterium sp. 13CS0277 TaxID=2071994 RepID=UPI0011B273CD|nr:putative peptidoglycan glycosyltransferase FtsW [Corynebacterium sp. 13CS0277]